MEREALKLALEVLEDLPGFRADIDKAIAAIKEALAQPAQEPVAWMYDWLCDGKLITGWIAHSESEIPKSMAFNIRPLYTAPPQLALEPVAWMYPDALCDRACLYVCTKAFTQFPECATTPPQPAQEPVADRDAFERHWKKVRGEKKSDRELKRHPLQPQTYIQDSANRHWVTWQAATKKSFPPQRTWVDLTDDEWFEWWRVSPIADETEAEIDFADFLIIAQAVVAKLKEKNT